MSDIIADIDALIDEQLDAGEPLNGYDYDDPQHPKCSHCHRDWHGLAITDRIEQLRSDWQRAQRRTHGCGCSICAVAWSRDRDREPDPITLDAATKALDEYRYATDDSEVLCPGSGFIGPWAAAATLQKIRDGWPDEQLWALPDNPLDGLSWVRRLIWPNPLLPELAQFDRPVYDYGRPERGGSRITYSVVDELPAMRRWMNPYAFTVAPIDPASTAPRPWMWVPRERAFPAYTVEKTLRSRPRSAIWDTLGEHCELKITGTLPELVDATIETTGSIPSWATDADTLARRAIEPWPRRANPRAILDSWMAEVVSSWSTAAPATWTVTVGVGEPLREMTPLQPVTRERDEPPMWAVDATRRRRR